MKQPMTASPRGCTPLISAVHFVRFVRRNCLMKHYLDTAEQAARAAGKCFATIFGSGKRVNAVTHTM